LPLIRFKKQFHDAIACGRKTTTLRRWRKCRWQAGDLLTAPGVGSLMLEAVEAVDWTSLTDADARCDGFESMAELNRVIRRIYPDMDGDGKSWFRLRFHQERPSPRRQLAAVVIAELDKAVRGNGSYPVHE
jgi:hypothetical protein